jgi:low affinity Fe/Cu permease
MADLPRQGPSVFDRFAERISQAVSGGAFFGGAVLLVVIWLPSVLVFKSVDTWQLVASTATSVLAFLLVTLLQNSERRKDEATHAKLNELAAAVAQLLDGEADSSPQAAACAARLRDAIGVEERI